MSTPVKLFVTAALALATIGASAFAADTRDAGRRVLNVLDFGAKCDGQADDTAALQAVASKAANSVVEIPVGVCRITGPVTFRGPYTHLRGQGVYASTILQTADDQDAIVFSTEDPASKPIYGSEISDIWIRHKGGKSRGAGLRVAFTNGFYASNIDVRDFFENIVIQGGSAVYLSNVTATAGGEFQKLEKGSSLIRVACGVDANKRCRIPGEIFFSNVDAKATPNNFVDVALRVEAVDGLWISNAHIGFADVQALIAPAVENAGIQSVYFSNVGLDGNNSARAGLVIPRVRLAGSFVRDVVLVGGDVEDLVGNGVEVDDPGAQLTLTGVPIRHVHGWGANAKSAGWISLSNALVDDVGSPDTGALNLAGAQNASAQGLGFLNIKGACLVYDRDSPAQKAMMAGLLLPKSCAKAQ